MDPEQIDDWRAIRAEQTLLRARLEQLEQRLVRFERGEGASPVPATVAPGSLLPTSPAAPPPLPPPLPVVTPGVRRESMEERIGTDWLVRAGVVLVLTALAFLGDYLYKNIVPRLGPVSKVGLLYLGAGALAGLGAWLERSRLGREMPKVRNYARVLLAGGLAAVYYVTYAAHYNPNLRVIGSPFLAGVLLVGWSVFMVWLADRRGSETLATLAILLAFYTSAINEVNGFTLVSNLPLAAGAVFLLRRHLWKVFPFASLLATFGSYGYWRYFHAYVEWRGLDGPSSRDTGGFWVEFAFLLLYWLLFTGAVFSTTEQTLPTTRRAGFASLNNGAFFLLATWSVLGDHPDAFWKWSLGFGVVLVALAELGRRLPRRLDEPTQTAFLLQGILLVTLGFITYFSGWQLCVILAVQSVVLLAAAGRRANHWLLAASVATAVLSFYLVMQQLAEPAGGYFRGLAPVVAALLAFNAWRSERWVDPGPAGTSVGRVAAGLYELLALGLCLVWGDRHFPYEAKFAFFGLTGTVVFAAGIAARQQRWVWWSYVLTSAGLLYFALGYGSHEHRQPLQWLGVACLASQQQFGRRRGTSGPEVTARFPPRAQGALIMAAVISAWVALSAIVKPWGADSGFVMAASWSLYAAAVFAVGLALRERVYRWLALVVLVVTLGHVVLFDIWLLDSLGRFFSLLCLGVVLLAIGFVYTRYHARLRDIF